jgi:type I restriction enzyme, R subunit
MTALSRRNLHTERVVQEHLVEQLISLQGYRRRFSEHHDRDLAADCDLLVEFLSTTQPEEWAKLKDHYTGQAVLTLMTQLNRALKDHGTLKVLRQGLKLVPGIKFSLCFFRPASGLNPELERLYEANILSVIEEVEYSTKHGNRIDVVLYVNGLPVATMELKNSLTGTTHKHAEKQYRADRSPTGEPLLTFERGALVHFAVDQDYVSMATRLRNGKTFFLPFNRGRDGGAGNPDIEGEFRIAYLYADQPEGKAVLGREVLLDIIGRFLFVERKEREREDGSTVTEKTLIFPRFQQLDAVRKLMAHAKADGPGQNYLIQHSAGSGKSNTIGWAAHQAVNLHTDDDDPVFHTAIIVTDRRVLDRQLQKTVSDLEQTAGVVKKIDGTSRQLKAAIESGAKIIVTTIQKFSTEHLKVVSGQRDRRFVVVVDEAHGSQSGKSAQALAQALTREEDDLPPDALEEIIAGFQRERGPQLNISYFAFTATPRNVTLERFGVKVPDGTPRPFHLYSMRQAIEEDFILDVLQHYMTYKAYYALEKAVEKDPKFQGSNARRKVARFAKLHPTAIAQKVEVIVEHFRRHVEGELAGHAKAMVVTGSREEAFRYHRAIERYVHENGYPLGALVAFSGDLEIDGDTYTEAEINGFAETELPKRFDKGDYHVLVVAEKYQTGFDQPKLCAMYVDRKLSGLQAVQTLSRLNRKMSGKERTYVLDFQNTIEDIQKAFRPFYETTELEANSDPNQIYILQDKLKGFGFLDQDEIDRFAELFYARKLTIQDRIAIEALLRNAVARFKAEEDETRQEEFRQLLKSYQRFYTFLAQIMSLDDAKLEKLYEYASWLSRLLPSREAPEDIEITDKMLKLQAFKVVQKEGGKASLSPGDNAKLPPISEFAAKPFTEEEEKSLSEIIEAFNAKHGTEFSDADFLRFEAVKDDVLDEDMMATLANNPPDVSRGAFDQAFFRGAVRAFQRDREMQSIILSDAEARERVFALMFSRALRQVRENRP